MADTKYCKHCGQVIDADCVVCPKCGKQVEDLKSDQKSVIINNSASSSASSSAAADANARVYVTGKPKNKWVAFFLCLFTLCGHKFYEGKFGMGILYLCTLGLFGIGWLIDLFTILGKPNPYYV